jgi:hypothetical protein
LMGRRVVGPDEGLMALLEVQGAPRQ